VRPAARFDSDEMEEALCHGQVRGVQRRPDCFGPFLDPAPFVLVAKAALTLLVEGNKMVRDSMLASLPKIEAHHQNSSMQTPSVTN
jgi:hypothetical protein